jgi:hypothetical protein
MLIRKPGTMSVADLANYLRPSSFTMSRSGAPRASCFVHDGVAYCKCDILTGGCLHLPRFGQRGAGR